MLPWQSLQFRLARKAIPLPAWRRKPEPADRVSRTYGSVVQGLSLRAIRLAMEDTSHGPTRSNKTSCGYARTATRRLPIFAVFAPLLRSITEELVVRWASIRMAQRLTHNV